MDPIEYIKSYYNSQGFNRRLNNHKSFLKAPKDKVLRFNKNRFALNEVRPQIPFEDQKNAVYDPNDHNIYVGKDVQNLPISVSLNKNNTLAHEATHALENSLGIKWGFLKHVYKDKNRFDNRFMHDGDIEDYSDYIPALKKSKAYNDYINSAVGKNIKNVEHFNWVTAVDPLAHDARPTESYADLGALRYDLFNEGIFDSRSKNAKFDKSLLNKYKSKNKDKGKQRIFNNFTDDQIIWMINNIAQNDKTNSNYHLEDLPYKNEYL